MNTSSIMKKRTKIFIITFIFIIVGVIATYMIFGNSTDVIYSNKNIRVTLENKKNGIQFGAYPMTYEEGIASAPSNIFKIVNKGSKKTEYQVIITDTSENENKIDINKIVVAIDDEEIKKLSDVVDGIVYSSSLGKNEEKILNLKIWLDSESTTETDLNSSLKLNVDIKEKWEKIN